MATVNVLSTGVNGAAQAGNRSTMAIALLVTDPDGKPVTGLTKADFHVKQIAGSGTQSSNVVHAAIDNGATQAKFRGYYTLLVRPKSTSDWIRGEYAYAVVVTSPKTVRPTWIGRGLAKTLIPPATSN